MGGGGSKTNRALEEDRRRERERQDLIFAKAFEESPEQKRFREQSAAWDAWLKKKDFSSGPEGTLLDFDLWNPAHTAEQARRMDNITGIGAVGMGGDDSTALQLARHRQNNAAATDAGAAYENAVVGTDNYYRGNALPYMQANNAKYGSLFGQQSQNANNATNAWVQYKSKPSPWGQILGSAIQTGGQLASMFI